MPNNPEHRKLFFSPMAAEELPDDLGKDDGKD